MTSTNSTRINRAIAIAVAAAVTQAAYGQSAQPADMAEQALRVAQASTSNPSKSAPAVLDETIEEIIVRGMARRYLPDEQTSATGLPMRLIETPQSITVLTPEMLAIANAGDAYGAADLVPGVEKAGEYGGYGRLILRGQPLTRPRVEGIQVGSASNVGSTNFPDSFAVDRIEFVRGPATVLYGTTGAFGGEVNSILKNPLSSWGSEIGLNVADFDRRRVEADLTGPLTADGSLAFRLVGSYEEYGAPITSIDIDNRVKMIYGALDYEFLPDWQLSLKYYHEDKDVNPRDGCALVLDADGKLSLPNIPTERYYCNGPDGYSHITPTYFIASVDHNFTNGWRFDAKAAWSEVQQRLSYMYPFGPAGAYDLEDTDVYLYTYDLLDEGYELSFNASLGGQFELFSREHRFHAALESQTTPKDTRRSFLESVGVGYLNIYEAWRGVMADGEPIPYVDRSQLDVAMDRRSSVDTVKASLQFLFDVTDRFEILAGSLIQRSEIEQRLLVPEGEPAIDQSFTEVVSRLGVTYDLADSGAVLDDARIYASFSEGFQPNIGEFGVDGTALTDPQEMKSYEIGLKAEFFEGAVAASIAAYDSEVTNVPTAVFEIGGFAAGYSTLSGKQKVQGIEVEALGELLPGWNVAFNYGYTETEIEDESFPTLDLVVRSVPKHRASLFTTYEFLRGALRGVRVGTSVVYKDDYPFVDSTPREVFNYGQLIDSGYTRVDFRVSYAGFTGSFAGLELAAFVENAFDAEYYHSNIGYAGFGITREMPRVLGFDVRYRFGAARPVGRRE